VCVCITRCRVTLYTYHAGAEAPCRGVDLHRPVKPKTMVQCYILRNRKGISNKLYPSYELYTKDDQFLAAAKKR